MLLVENLISFLKQPQMNKPVVLSLKGLGIILFQSLILYFIIIFICSLFFIPLSVFNLIPEIPKHQKSETIWIILYAPILEELFFRLPLRNFFRNIFITLAMFFYAFMKNYIGIIPTLVLSSLIAVLPYIPHFICRYENHINEKINNYYPFIFYFVALLFGFLHITNFKTLTTNILLVSPVIVLFQLFMGLLLGFIRINYSPGILYSILVHIIYNSIPILIKIL
jgi:hypothetical protein